MIVHQLFLDNELRNFNYIVACEETGEALAIDPLAADACLATAAEHNLTITKILNTHEHWDHIGGNQQLINHTGATLYAHVNAATHIPGIDVGLNGGDIIKVGSSVEFEVLDTPGHTFCHVCLYAHTDEPALFSGDTLFNAGCGHCRSGSVESMYQTFTQVLSTLADDTVLYPGHDYLQNNLNFSLNREPTNSFAQQLLSDVEQQHNPHQPMRTTLAIEQMINPFFRLHEMQLRENLGLTNEESAQEVFSALRAMRDKW